MRVTLLRQVMRVCATRREALLFLLLLCILRAVLPIVRAFVAPFATAHLYAFSEIPATCAAVPPFDSVAVRGCREWAQACSQPWRDVIHAATARFGTSGYCAGCSTGVSDAHMDIPNGGDLRCYGKAAEDGRFCVAPVVCVNGSGGAWVPAESLLPMAAAAARMNDDALPGLLMTGLDGKTDSMRYALPVRGSTDFEFTVGSRLVPAVVISFYECSHLSHFLFNGLIPAFSAWLRAGGRRDTVLIVERAMGDCPFAEVLGAFFNLSHVWRSEHGRFPLLRLDMPMSLPLKPVCMGPVFIGSRSTCLHSYCAETFTPGEREVLRGIVLAHYGISPTPRRRDSFQAAPAQSSPLRVTLVQRERTRVIVNLDAVLATLAALADEISANCSLTALKATIRLSFRTTMIPLCAPVVDGNDAGAAEQVPKPELRSPVTSRHPPFVVDVVYMENVPLRDQIALAARTDVLLAAHGNAVGISLFQRRGSAVVEVMMKDWFSPWYRDPILETFGLHYENVSCWDRSCLPLTNDELEQELLMKAADPLHFEFRVKNRNVSVPLPALRAAMLRALDVSAASRAYGKSTSTNNVVSSPERHSTQVSTALRMSKSDTSAAPDAASISTCGILPLSPWPTNDHHA